MTGTPTVDDVRARLDAVVAAIRYAGLWELRRPDDQNTMSFAQWLCFVFVPNVEKLIASNGPFPQSSQVAVIAAREGDTDPRVAALVPALAAFDALFGEGD